MKASHDPLEIRLAHADEAQAIASVLQQAFIEVQALYTPDAYAITTPDWVQIQNRWTEGPVWVAVHENAIVGTIAAVPKEEGFYLRSTAVLPEARGKGIGRTLLKYVEQYARDRGYKRMYLSTTPFLTGAIRLYEKCGFHRVDEGPLELSGTPLFTMEKFL